MGITLKVEISTTTSAKVFILYEQLPHLEMLNMLKHGTNNTIMWSVIMFLRD